MPKLSREEYERRFAERLASCRRAYDEAKAGSADMVRQLNAGGFMEPDGSQAYRNALVAERVALKAYIQAVKTFSDFLCQGKIPEEDTGSER